MTPQTAQKGVSYSCPECDGAVRLRGGIHRKKHFYHLNSSQSCRQNGKSPTHLCIQMLLQSRFTNSSLEHLFPEISRIADLFCPKENMVIEVQCSPISLEEIEARNAAYASLGLFVLWLFHERRFSPKRSIFPFPHYFTNITAHGSGSIYDYRKGKRYPVDLTNPLTPKSLRSLPRYLKLRHQRWKKAFAGDLVDQALKKRSFLQSLLSKL